MSGYIASRHLMKRHGFNQVCSTADFHALHRFSVEHANEFWLALWRFTDVQASVHPTKMSLRQPLFNPGLATLTRIERYPRRRQNR